MPHTNFFNKTGYRLLKISGHAAALGASKQKQSTEFSSTLCADEIIYPVEYFPLEIPSIASFNEALLAEGIHRSSPEEHIYSSVLPDAVVFRTMTESFNFKYQFVLRTILLNTEIRNVIFFKNHTAGQWTPIDNPIGVKNFAAISCDDSFLVAIDQCNSKIYTLYFVDNDAAKHPFKWTSNWGSPLWRGKGEYLPPYRAFSLSYLSPMNHIVGANIERRLFPEIRQPSAANIKFSLQKPSIFELFNTDFKRFTPIGVGVTTIFLLEVDGQQIRYFDPWLNAQDIRKILTPKKGRIRCINLCASASMIAIMAEDGCIYTRYWDFDLSGGDDLILYYTTKNSVGRHLPLMNPEFDFDLWEKQPDLPLGTCSAKVSVIFCGSHAKHYLLMVEGQVSAPNHFGEVCLTYGFYFKHVEQGVYYKSSWRFFPIKPGTTTFPYITVIKRHDGTSIEYPPPFTYAGKLISYSSDMCFLRPESVYLHNFTPYESPSVITATLANGHKIILWLHNYDITRMSKPRYDEGLTESEWPQKGLLQIPHALYTKLTEYGKTGDEVCQNFLNIFDKHSENGHFTKVHLNITNQVLKIQIGRLQKLKIDSSAELVFSLRKL